MSELAREFFQHNPAIAGPLLAMLIFGVVFALATVRAMRASDEYIERMASLALEGEERSDV